MTRGAAGAPASDDVGELMALPPVPAAKMGVASQDDVGSSELARKHRHSRAAYWIMCLLGAGLLLPWNAVVNAVDFFDSLYVPHRAPPQYCHGSHTAFPPLFWLHN